MKKNFNLFFILAVILCSGLFIISTVKITPKKTSMINNDNNTELNSLVLGDVEGNFSPAFTAFDLTFLSGEIWAASSGESKIYKISPYNGATISFIDIAFEASGLTTNGIYLYASLLDSGSGNGTIAKYQTDGTFVSKIYIPLNDHYFRGLAWDGSYLWASQINPNRVVRINPNTGEIITNVSTDYPLVGLVWRNNLLWGADSDGNSIRAVDPSTGRTQEVFDPPITVGEYGLAYNGTNFLFSELSTNTIHILDIPTDFGEVWNQHSSPDTFPLELAWNGTHYFLFESDVNKIFILNDGTFEVVDEFDITFEAYGLAVVGNYLYITQIGSPYYIHKYTLDGTYVSSFTSVYPYYALEYEEGRLWGSVHMDAAITELDPIDCSVIDIYSVQENYAGLTYDSVRNVFWAVDWDDDKIFQLNPSTFQKTGVEINSPTGNGDFGLEFNGEYLILTEHGIDTIYKIIIDIPSDDGGGIPGFANYLILLTIITLIGLIFFIKRSKTLFQKL